LPTGGQNLYLVSPFKEDKEESIPGIKPTTTNLYRAKQNAPTPRFKARERLRTPQDFSEIGNVRWILQQ
jgi:hypothetical protein